MRVYVNEDCDDWLAHGRWIARTKVAINGKRGQAFLRELHAALLALPEKKLIANVLALEEHGAVCSLGALGLARGESLADMDGDEIDEDKAAARFGCTPTMAWNVIYENDDFQGTPEQRYAHVLKWVEFNLATPEPRP